MAFEIKGDVITGNSISANAAIKTELSAPIMVAFDITNRCNFKCLHCFNHSGEDIFQDELSDVDKIAVAEQIRDMAPYVVCLCGGETTCCNVLEQIILTLKEKVASINMVSNGYLINKEYALNLKKWGVSLVQISVDGINPEQHDTFRGHYGAFEHAINAIKILKEVGLSVATSFVPNKLNYKDTYQYFKMCNELGVNQARSMPFLPLGRGMVIGNRLILNREENYQFIRQLIKAKQDFPQMEIEWGDPIDHIYRMPANAKVGIDSYSMDVKSNGDIGVSGYFPVYVGNCKLHTLHEYWLSGYNKIWGNKTIQKIVEQVEVVNDFTKIAEMNTLKFDIIGGKL